MLLFGALASHMLDDFVQNFNSTKLLHDLCCSTLSSAHLYQIHPLCYNNRQSLSDINLACTVLNEKEDFLSQIL